MAELGLMWSFNCGIHKTMEPGRMQRVVMPWITVQYFPRKSIVSSNNTFKTSPLITMFFRSPIIDIIKQPDEVQLFINTI